MVQEEVSLALALACVGFFALWNTLTTSECNKEGLAMLVALFLVEGGSEGFLMRNRTLLVTLRVAIFWVFMSCGIDSPAAALSMAVGCDAIQLLFRSGWAAHL